MEADVRWYCAILPAVKVGSLHDKLKQPPAAARF